MLSKKSGISVKAYTQFKNNVINKKDTKKFNYNQFEAIFFEKHCDIETQYRSVYIYLTLIYTIIVVLLPLIIVSLFNTLLIGRLYSSKDEFALAKLGIHEQEMSYKELRDKKVQIENIKTTWMLVIISASFILLTSPHAIVYFTRHIINMNKNSSKSGHTHTSNSSLGVFMPLIIRFTELLYIFFHSFRRVLKEKMRCNCFSKTYLARNSKTATFSFSTYLQRISAKSKNVNSNTQSTKKTNATIKKSSLQQSEMKNKDEEEIMIEKSNKTIQPEDYEKFWEFIPNSPAVDEINSSKNVSSKNKKK